MGFIVEFVLSDNLVKLCLKAICQNYSQPKASKGPVQFTGLLHLAPFLHFSRCKMLFVRYTSQQLIGLSKEYTYSLHTPTTSLPISEIDYSFRGVNFVDLPKAKRRRGVWYAIDY